ncbi:phage portal protein [Paenibacillus camelliae]|uniref:phage portal protein n=1 Tax=Paenibacillus camelliae TaxID=512410 RepID=UPI00203AB766|nr:phage portal protein [Paenibacillus camelliae]
MKARSEIARQQMLQEVFNQGYGDHGGSKRKKALKAWNPGIGDADSDIHQNLENLRPRARDLYMGGALSAGALKTMRTNIVGTGLKLKPAFDAEFLKLTDEQANKLKQQIEREFALWSESKDCDATGMHNFVELQQLAFLSWMMSGDVFALLPLIKRPHTVYDLRIKLVEADRCSTPKNSAQVLLDGNKIQSGVEVDKDGMVCAYHFSDRHPGASNYYSGANVMKWQRVELFGKKTGRRNVLHLMEAERPEQRRGVPVLAPVIEALKQLERYTEAELMAAVISGMFTVFIESEADPSDDILGVPLENPTGEPLPSSEEEIGLGNGAVQFLQPGEKANIANPGRPNAQFDPFVTSILRQVGAALELPYELLLKHFTASYSASRAALLEAWKMFRMRRSWLASDFCQPVYEDWFIEAVSKGRIDAPGIFDDPAIFKAYTKAEWHGPSQGLLDPVKEVNAAILKVNNGFSSRQRESAELNGSEYETNVKQLAYEQSIRQQNGIEHLAINKNGTPISDPSKGGDEDSEED